MYQLNVSALRAAYGISRYSECERMVANQAAWKAERRNLDRMLVAKLAQDQLREERLQAKRDKLACALDQRRRIVSGASRAASIAISWHKAQGLF